MMPVIAGVFITTPVVTGGATVLKSAAFPAASVIPAVILVGSTAIPSVS